jgi:hypothetical protein
MKGLLGALTGIGPILDAGKTGGRSLLDPIGSSNPQLQKYTDVAGLIHPVGGMDYKTGLTIAQKQSIEDESNKQKSIYADYNRQKLLNAKAGPSSNVSTILPTMSSMKKGGSVKSSASSRGDGIAQRGKTKGRMV